MRVTGDLARRCGRALMGGPGRRRLYALANRVGPKLLGSRVRSGPARGLRLRGGDTIGYLLGVSEPLVQRALVEHLREGDVLYDIGSHAGFEALLGCRLVGDAGHVHCFEPVPDNVAVLRSNIAANAFANATVHAVALSDVDGSARMDLGDRRMTARLDGDGDLEVATARLDSIDLPPPIVVKIDVEGAEAAVLRGMQRTLRAHRPVVIVEIHDAQEAPVRHELAAAGYSRVTHLDDGGMPHLLARP